MANKVEKKSVKVVYKGGSVPFCRLKIPCSSVEKCKNDRESFGCLHYVKERNGRV